MKKILLVLAMAVLVLFCPIVLASCGVKDLINPKPVVKFQEDLVYFLKDNGLPTPESVTYSDYEVPGTFKYVEDDKNKIEVGVEKAYRYVFTPTDTSSFKTVKSNIKLIAVEKIYEAEDIVLGEEETILVIKAEGEEKKTVVFKNCDFTEGFNFYDLNVIFDNCTFNEEAEMKLVRCTVIKELKTSVPSTVEVLEDDPVVEEELIEE